MCVSPLLRVFSFAQKSCASRPRPAPPAAPLVAHSFRACSCAHCAPSFRPPAVVAACTPRSSAPFVPRSLAGRAARPACPLVSSRPSRRSVVMSASGGGSVAASAAAGGPLVAQSGSRKKRRAATSVARVYADVNTQRPNSYWDYEKMEIEWRSTHTTTQQRGESGEQARASKRGRPWQPRVLVPCRARDAARPRDLALTFPSSSLFVLCSCFRVV